MLHTGLGCLPRICIFNSDPALRTYQAAVPDLYRPTEQPRLRPAGAMPADSRWREPTHWAVLLRAILERAACGREPCVLGLTVWGTGAAQEDGGPRLGYDGAAMVMLGAVRQALPSQPHMKAVWVMGPKGTGSQPLDCARGVAHMMRIVRNSADAVTCMVCYDQQIQVSTQGPAEPGTHALQTLRGCLRLNAIWSFTDVSFHPPRH